MAFLDILPGDGVGSAWDSATALYSGINGGMAVLLILFGEESLPDATIARLRFVALADVPDEGRVFSLTSGIRARIS